MSVENQLEKDSLNAENVTKPSMTKGQSSSSTTRSKLTRKQKGFVKDYVETGNGSLAVKKNYEVTTDLTARTIASENLTKPNIIKAIQEALPDDLLAKKHLELFDQKRIDYFVFPKRMEDDEIVDHVASVGIKVITVRETDKGKMAFYSITDAQAITKALDMSYKLKGSYAAEKTQALNLNIEARLEDKSGVEAIRDEYEEKLRKQLTDETK